MRSWLQKCHHFHLEFIVTNTINQHLMNPLKVIEKIIKQQSL